MGREIIFHEEYFIDFYIVLFNGFQKKTQKTPKKEIEKEMKLKEEYFKQKNLES